MKRAPLKILAFSSIFALGLATAQHSHAQTETVNAQLITTSAISTTDVSDMDFGTWLIQFVAGDTPALTLTNDGTTTTTQTGSVANGSQVINITPTTTEGVVNVQTPAPAALTITRSSSSDFTDTNLSLTDTDYRTATDGNNALDGDTDTGTVTTTVAATDEAVTFGGIIAITGTPADNTHAAQFDVTFTY